MIELLNFVPKILTNNLTQDSLNEVDNLVAILIEKAKKQPNQIAYRFLEDGETESDSITYKQLDRKARAIASYLQTQKTSLHDRALLLYPSSIDFIAAFLGCLYAGVIAVPATLLRKREKTSRLEAIANNCQPKFVLTTSSLLPNLKERLVENADFQEIEWVATDSISQKLASKWQKPDLDGNNIAFLQYTSGSTGKPKGVTVTHKNIMYNQEMIKAAFSHTEKTVFVGWLPLFHDMGLIGNVLQPLYLGIPCILMPPEAFLLKPIRWLKAISKYKATTSGGPNFAYDLLSMIPSEQLENLDLSSWDIAFCGAEPIRVETLAKFTTKFKSYGLKTETFYPCYGMAETTLFVSGGKKTNPPFIHNVDGVSLAKNRVVSVKSNHPETQQIVGCGQTWLDQEIIIVNPESLRKCPEGEVGEIWISGDNVAQGYWDNPEETEKTFYSYPQDIHSKPFLRTGDLGFILDRELFVTGRLKDLIIIRGCNYYPQDIELTVERTHPGLRTNSGAAFVVEVEGEQQLIVANEIKRTYLRKLNFKEVMEAVRLNVSRHHNLKVYKVLLLKTGSIPKTSSGKIKRHACRVEFLNQTLNIVSE